MKYAWNGDVNLDEVVDAADYLLIDAAFIAQAGTLAGGEAPAGTKEAAMVTALIKPHSEQTPSVLAQLFSSKPVL
ncbi:MAG TPA: hypothetical protein VHP11_06920 [Tepidisphaeraceae bacterium]|nr:hypothetical protein [Tepidisphaeraceae bacterium]